MLRKNKLLNFIELLYLIIVIISVASFYLSQAGATLFFNADTLFIGDFFKNLLYENGSIRNWIFPSTFCFFPDWLLLVIANLVTKKIYFQLLIVACLNILLLYLVVKIIYRQFFSKTESLLFTFTSIGFFTLLAINLFEPYLMLLTICYHAGAFITGLFYIFLQLKYSKDNLTKKEKFFLIFIAVCISLIMGISDPIFLAQFSIPVFFTSFAMWAIKKKSFKDSFLIAFTPLVVAIIGVSLIDKLPLRTMLFEYLDHPSLSKITIKTIFDNINYLKDSVKFFLNPPYGILIIFVLFYLSIIAFLLFYKKLQIKKEIFLNMFILVSVTFNIASFLITKRPPTNRYLMTFYFFPILLFFFISLGYKNIYKFFHIIAYVTFLLLIYKTVTIFLSEKIQFKKKFYPEEILCVDNLLRNYDHYGVANYWDARIYTNFSQVGLKVDAADTNLIPFNPIGNTKHFKNSYSFIITEVSPSSEIKKFWAPNDKLIKLYHPTVIKICGGKKIIVFNKNRLKISYFKKIGDEFTWMADMLPSRFPSTSIQEDGSRIAKPTDTSGYLTYGPYINLPEGSYQFLINYTSNSPLNIPAASWDISEVKSGQINQGTLKGTNNKNSIFKGKFTIKKFHKNDLYEIRVYFNSGYQFIINSIKLIKIY